MKIRIEMFEGVQEEVVIRCREITPEIIRLQQLLSGNSDRSNQFLVYKGDTEYYLNVNDIIFFETEGNAVMAHTKNDMYETRRKLYELEELSGGRFQRISKSAIVNVDKVYSIKRNVTSSSAIEFQGTHKQIYVSRAYYKVLREKLEEKR
ncbi:MAG: LytTR family DNA-binding domain-containing protein [Lachnospira sp.]|nr:LytTR family DNA-binding domain-containing protein [Lachnospira sp.]